MKPTILFVSLFLFSHITLANLIIENINSTEKMILAKKQIPEDILIHDQYSITFENKHQCTLEVKKVEANLVFLSANTCTIKEFKVGQTLEKSDFPKILVCESETWYASIHLGLSYFSPANGIKNNVNKDLFSLGIEPLSFAWPVYKPGFLLGFIAGGGYYRIDSRINNGDLLLSSGGSYLSLKHFNSGKVGHGQFVRFDLGYRYYRFSFFPDDFNKPIDNRSTELFSYQVGIGISSHIFKKSHLMIETIFSHTPNSDIEKFNMQFLLGLMW